MHGDKVHVDDEPTDIVCEKCGSPMVIKTGRYGKYLACSNYPACSNMRSLKERSAPKQTDVKCDVCGAMMLEREGKFGKYLACSNFPQCKNTKPIIEVRSVAEVRLCFVGYPDRQTVPRVRTAACLPRVQGEEERAVLFS